MRCRLPLCWYHLNNKVRCYNHLKVRYYNHLKVRYYNHLNVRYYNHFKVLYYNHLKVRYYNHLKVRYYNHLKVRYYNHFKVLYYNHFKVLYYNHLKVRYYNHLKVREIDLQPAEFLFVRCFPVQVLWVLFVRHSLVLLVVFEGPWRGVHQGGKGKGDGHVQQEPWDTPTRKNNT